MIGSINLVIKKECDNGNLRTL